MSIYKEAGYPPSVFVELSNWLSFELVIFQTGYLLNWLSFKLVIFQTGYLLNVFAFYQTDYLSNDLANLKSGPSSLFEPYVFRNSIESSIFRLPFERTFLVWEVLLALCV